MKFFAVALVAGLASANVIERAAKTPPVCKRVTSSCNAAEFYHATKYCSTYLAIPDATSTHTYTITKGATVAPTSCSATWSGTGSWNDPHHTHHPHPFKRQNIDVVAEPPCFGTAGGAASISKSCHCIDIPTSTKVVSTTVTVHDRKRAVVTADCDPGHW